MSQELKSPSEENQGGHRATDITVLRVFVQRRFAYREGKEMNSEGRVRMPARRHLDIWTIAPHLSQIGGTVSFPFNVFCISYFCSYSVSFIYFLTFFFTAQHLSSLDFQASNTRTHSSLILLQGHLFSILAHCPYALPVFDGLGL